MLDLRFPRRRLSGSRVPARVSLSQVAAGALLGCALTLGISRIFQPIPAKSASPQRAVELQLKIAPLRLTLGRMGGQGDYAPYPTPLRRQDGPAFARFCREALAWTASTTSQRLRDAAFCELGHKRFDAAVDDLESAARMEPGNAQLLSDLSAVYGERAGAEDRPEDYAKALEMAEKAVALAPKLPEALFNRALALEHLFLEGNAWSAWESYLRTDAQSPWGAEAQAHFELDRARDKLAEARSPCGDIAQDARVMSRHASSVKRLLQFADMIRCLDRPRFLTEDLRKSLRLLPAVKEALEITRMYRNDHQCDPGGIWELSPTRESLLAIEFREAVCRYHDDFLDGAQAVLDYIGKSPSLADYPDLQARRQLMLGLVAQRRSSFTDALSSYGRALALFKALGDEQNAAWTQSQMAESLDALGQYSEAWRYRYRALDRTRGRLFTPQRLTILEQAVLASMDQGLPETALDFQETLSKACTPVLGRLDCASILLRGAQLKAALGRLKEARRDLEVATRALESEPPPRRDLATFAAKIDLARREVAAGENRAAVIASTLSAPRTPMSARADDDFRRGDTAAAERDLERELGQVEQQRSSLGEGDYRTSFLDREQPLYDRLVALELNLGRPEKALEVLERSRARALLDQLQTSEQGRHEAGRIYSIPLSGRELWASVPPDTIIVVYAVVEDRLVTWLIRSSGIEQIYGGHQPWDRISTEIDRLHEVQGGGLEKDHAILAALAAELIAPWRGELADGVRIVFVPTRSLFDVPFAALPDPFSDRFLIQDHPIGIAASASEFIAAMERDQQISVASPRSVLLIGNSTGNRPALGFAPLPGAAAELERLSGTYQGLDTRVLTGAAATPEAVLASIAKAEIVHLAVHGVRDAKDPARSHLVLSSSDTRPGLLFAQDILHLHLPRTRIVMLAACETGAGRVSPSEGALSLASFFLAAGVPAVVGTLRPVEDAGTERMSVRFHQELRRGADAFSALRSSQLEEIARQKGRFDWTWASFQVFGGVAERASGEGSGLERQKAGVGY